VRKGFVPKSKYFFTIHFSLAVQDLAMGAPFRDVYPAFEREGASTVSLNHPLEGEDYGSTE
jgi:hypothetical protein